MANSAKKQHSLFVFSAFALVLAVGTAGCGANNGPSGQRAGSGAEPSALEFSRCMRGQGFAWFPDPDSSGNLKVNEPQSLDRTKYQQAQKSCEKYAPWGGGGGNETSPQDLEKSRKMSQCMRDHGFANFPDPDRNGAINLDKSSGISPDDPAFQKAQQECRKFTPASPRRTS